MSITFESSSVNGLTLSSHDLIRMQPNGRSLKEFMVLANGESDSSRAICFKFVNGVLIRCYHDKFRSSDFERTPIAVPTPLRSKLIYISHDIPFAGRLGIRKIHFLGIL